MTYFSKSDVIDDRVMETELNFRPRIQATPLHLDNHPGCRLVFMTEPNGLAVEQYKLIRRRLEALSPQGGLLIVTSPGAGEGKTLTSINLAWCLAEGGHTTCLVDMDFRAPGVSMTLGHNRAEDGVAEILAGKRQVSELLHQIGDGPFYVLGISERLASPANQLTATALQPFLKGLRATFRWVILDMAPTVPMSDVAEVLPYVDGAIMVVRSGKTAKSLIAPTLEILGGKLWGVVSNDSQVNGSAYYAYYGYGNRP